MASRLRDALVVVSLANLLAAKMWANLFDPSQAYFLDAPRPPRDYVAAIIVVLLLAAIGLPLLRVLRRRPSITLDRLGLAAIVLSPLVVATFGLAAWHAMNEPAAFPSRAPAARPSTWNAGDPLAAPNRPRVVIVALDDDSAAAAERLRGNALVYPNAKAPGRSAETAIPSLLLGRHVESTAGAGANDRRLTLDDGSTVLFSEAPNILQKHDAAIAGFFHPYCRVLGDDVVECHSHAREALALATDPSLDLAFLHLPGGDLAELLAALDGAKLLDRTTLAVVPLRGPLLLRLPEGPPIEDSRAIPAIDVSALFPEILAGTIRTNGQAQAWLAARDVASRMAP